MKSSKVLLYPDHEAGFGWGLAVCEALACGIPVIAYNLPAYREFFREGTHLVEFGDLAEFAKATLEILNNESARIELGSKGKEFVQRYDWEIVSKDLLSAFELMSGGKLSVP
jgi:glycosyltransferase involved in cell wall biosynthesis